MPRFWRAPVFALATLGLLLAACGGDDDDDNDGGIVLFGVTPDNELVRFTVEDPSEVTTTAITGLEVGDAIRALDYRPADGVLYGLGTDSYVYTINTSTGVATPVGTGVDPAIPGTVFGWDFNPVADRIRVITNTQDNRRLDPGTGAQTSDDGDVSYVTGDDNEGETPGVTGAAYSNNFAGAATTVLFALDQNTDALVLVNPPNAGDLTTVGSLGVDIAGDAGFDISADSVAYAAIVPMGSSTPSLYTIDLATGTATLVGAIGSERLTGLAVRP